MNEVDAGILACPGLAPRTETPLFTYYVERSVTVSQDLCLQSRPSVPQYVALNITKSSGEIPRATERGGWRGKLQRQRGGDREREDYLKSLRSFHFQL